MDPGPFRKISRQGAAIGAILASALPDGNRGCAMIPERLWVPVSGRASR